MLARAALVTAVACSFGLARAGDAVQVASLDPLAAWRLRRLAIEGAQHVGARELRSAMATRARPWFALWRGWPPFDPLVFAADLERIATVYRRRGYYRAAIAHELAVDSDTRLVSATIRIEEHDPVRVASVTIERPPPEDSPCAAAVAEVSIPVTAGAIFTEAEYERGRLALLGACREAGHARARVEKGAVVDPLEGTAQVRYRVLPGPTCRFGKTVVDGLTSLASDVVLREVAWAPGEPFDPRLLDETRRRLLALRLFRSVRLDEEGGEAPQVDVRIVALEGPSREVRLGAGYETDEGPRGIASWRDYNFLGEARQLGVTARGSASRRTLAADFLQPHWPSPQSRLRLVFLQEQQAEDSYTLLLSRLAPRLEWDLTPRVSAFLFYRAELDLLTDVPRAVRRALPGGAPSNTVLSGFGIGLDWNGTDSLVDPSRGWAGRLAIEPVGGLLGGETSFVRAVADFRAYVPLPARIVAATRWRVGTAEPYGDTPVVPLWERFYAGGADSVRGYARRRVGPLAANDPIGGQSLLELSAELRRPITDRIGMAVFIDGGQVARGSRSYEWSAMQWGTGTGLRLSTPVGPVRADLGFPLDRRGDDTAWQVYLSIGQSF